MIDMSSDVRYSVLCEKSDSGWAPDNGVRDAPGGEHQSSGNTSSSVLSRQKKSYQTSKSNQSSSIAQQNSSLKSNELNKQHKQPSLSNEFELANAASKDLDLRNVGQIVSNDPIAATDEATNEPSSPRTNLDEQYLFASGNLNNLQNVPNHAFKTNTEQENKRNKWSTQRMVTEHFMLILIISLILLISLLLLTLVVMNRKLTLMAANNRTCTSDQCILVSSAIYKSLDRQADPCEDFYEYACGGFVKSTLIPAGFPRWGTLNLIAYENQLLIKDQMELNTTEVTEAETKARIFYKSCIDAKGIIETLAAKPLLEILGKFVYKNATSSQLVVNETFENLLSMIQITYGLNTIFEFNVLDDDKNSSYSNIEIIQGTLGLERSYYLNTSSEKNAKALDIYRKTMVNVINLLFGDVSNASEEMDKVFELETKIAKIMLPTERLSNVEEIYSLESMSNLNRLFMPYFDWKKFLNKFLKAYESNQTLTDSDSIIVMGFEYFESLKGLLDEYHSTHDKERTLKLTMIFHFVKFSLPLLSKEYRTQFGAIGEALTGTMALERWQTCIDHTDSIFGLGYAVTKMFLRAVPNNSKQLAQELIRSIKQSFIENFHKLKWMDKETSHLAEEKVNYVDELIGYPDFVENDTALDYRYKELNMFEDDYFGNEIRLVQYALKSEILTYRSRVNKADPMSVNYGSIGTIMGHELTHGFDDSGREYDKTGMMHQWWNNKTVESFKNATECIVDQYSKFKIEGESINGRQTLGENIADNGGLSAAYRAYEKWILENGEEKPLPLLSLSHRQLFFVSFAQTWCSKSTPDSAHLSLSVDHHSPPRFRVLGSIANSEGFSKVFNCPANKEMNSAHKCELW